MRRVSRLLIVSAIAAALAAVFAASSTAAEIEVRSCSNEPGAGLAATNEFWAPLANYSSPSIAVTGTCPTGMTFKTPQTTQGATGSWNFRFDPIKSAVDLRFLYEGGDPQGEWQYTVNNCPSTSCVTLATVPPAPEGSEPATFHIEITTPPTQLRVTAKCVVPICAASKPLNFHDVILKLRDETAPTAKVTLSTGYWSRSTEIKASASIADSGGVGLSTSVASIDGKDSILARGGCDLTSWFGGRTYVPPKNYCEQYISAPTQRLELPGISDGAHYVVVDAVDGVGNVMKTLKEKMLIDNTPPNTPEDAVVTGVNRFGWTQLDEVGVTWTNVGEEQETNTQSGIWLPRYTRKPYPGFSGASATVEGIFDVDNARSIKRVSLPTDAKWNLFISTKDRAQNESGALKVTVGRDRGIPAQPELASSGWMNQAALNKFKQPISQPAGNEISGICGYAALVDSDLHFDPPVNITDPGALQYLTIDRDLPDGVNRLHVRAMSCAEVASTTAETDIKVDRAAPAVFIDGVPSSSWTNKPVKAVVSATDALSGVAGVSYAVDGGSMQTVESDSAEVNAPQGVHTLRFAATDRAGNIAPALTREVRLDSIPPEVTIDEFDPAHPTWLGGTIHDELSGAASAVFEYRRADSEGPWTQLPTATQADAVGASSMTVTATIPDLDFDSGTYDFRLRASDIAGNVSPVPPSTQRQLPLREQPKLTALLATVDKCKSRRSCKSRGRINAGGAKSSRTIGYAAGIALIGELRDGRGGAIAGEKLKIYSAVGGSNSELVAEPATDARGKYEFRVPRGASRRFTVRYAGTGHFLPAAESADLGVAVGADLRVSRSRVRNGGSIVLTGRVRGVTARYPADGLLVVLKYFKPGAGWKPALDSPRVDANGRFAATPYKFTGLLSAAKTVKFKAFINTRRTGFPFVEGYSNVVSVRVLP